jgi:hypothetical protein
MAASAQEHVPSYEAWFIGWHKGAEKTLTVMFDAHPEILTVTIDPLRHSAEFSTTTPVDRAMLAAWCRPYGMDILAIAPRDIHLSFEADPDMKARWIDEHRSAYDQYRLELGHSTVDP